MGNGNTNTNGTFREEPIKVFIKIYSLVYYSVFKVKGYCGTICLSTSVASSDNLVVDYQVMPCDAEVSTTKNEKKNEGIAKEDSIQKKFDEV